MTRTKAATPKNGTSTAMSATTEATFSAVKDALRSLTFPVLASEPSLRESGTAGTASQSKPRRSRPHERQPLWQAVVEPGLPVPEKATYRYQEARPAEQDAVHLAGESSALMALLGC